ncbi:MAG: tetratricopeptide repeat protein [Acidobacteriota bacterium]|nr:tetratricopeptide repeat protein [Acidobacteriota bacterium]
MVVLPILLALTSAQCEASFQSVMTAVRQNDGPKATSLLESLSPDCSHSSSFYALTGTVDELTAKTLAAESAFRTAVSLDPKSPSLLEQLGAVYLRNNKPADAAVVLRDAVSLDPANQIAKKYLIAAYVGSNNWKPAATLFDEFGKAAFDPSDPILYLWFTQALAETGQLNRIDREVLPETSRMPPALLFSLGTFFAQHRMYQRAIKCLGEIPPTSADDAVYFNLGLSHSHLREFDEARKNYYLAIDHHPGHVDAYFRIGLDYASMGDVRRAIPWLFKAHGGRADRSEITYSLVEQLIQLKYFQTAQELLSGSEDPSAESLLAVADGDLKQATGDSVQAIRSYGKALRGDPASAPALVGLARAEISQGNVKQARSNLNAALARDPQDASANGELGLLDLEEGDLQSALTNLSKSWAENRSDAVALGLARAYRRLGQPSEALSVLTSLKPTMHASPAFHIELAQVYSALHRLPEAQSERESITRLEAQNRAGLHFDDPGVYVH